MPHYKDGTEAKIGDRVRGVGYNAGMKLYSVMEGVEGIVIDVRSGASCTLSVAFLRPVMPASLVNGQYIYPDGNVMAGGVPLRLDVEYGDTKGFSKIG